MRKKNIIIGVLALALMATTVPTGIYAMKSIEKSSITNEKTKKKIGKEKICLLQKDIDKLKTDKNEDEKKLKELTDEKEKTELEYALYDYKEEIEMRIRTVNVALDDMKSSIKRGLDEKQKKSFENRIKMLEPIVKKYEAILKDETDTTDYQTLAEKLNKELSSIYDKIN